MLSANPKASGRLPQPLPTELLSREQSPLGPHAAPAPVSGTPTRLASHAQKALFLRACARCPRGQGWAPREPLVAFLSADPPLPLPNIKSFLLAEDSQPRWCLRAPRLPPRVTAFPGSLPRGPCLPQPVPWQGARHPVPAHLPAFCGSTDLTSGMEPDRCCLRLFPQPERRDTAI